jgi:hypothetical protein
MPAGDIPNAIVVTLAVVVLTGFVYLWFFTRATGFLWKAVACAWACVARLLLSLHVEPFVTYSAQLILPFWILMAMGVWLTVGKLVSVYRPKHWHR